VIQGRADAHYSSMLSMRSPSILSRAAVWLILGAAAVGLSAACGGSAKAPDAASDGGVTSDGQAPPIADAGPSAEASTDGGNVSTDDSGSPGEDSGLAPRNAACTPSSAQTGTLVDTSHGRLDGTLVYIVSVGGTSKCNGDDSHVHLQIEVSGLVYDVAVDVGTTPDDEVGMIQQTMAVPGGAWSEGWHGTDALTYSSLGVSSTALPIATPDVIAGNVEAALESTTKISIFCTGYTPGDNGCHDVHYENGDGNDGAIVLDPTAAMSPVLFFRFQSQSF
jgi:hypothetical protein